MLKKTRKLLLILLLIICSNQLIAGWEITYRNTDTDGLITYEVMLIEDNILKYSGTDISFIFDATDEMLTFIINYNQSYWTGKIDHFRNELDKALQTAMKEMIEQLPESQQQIYGQMLDGMAQMYATPTPEAIKALDLKITNTGETENIAGYISVKYQILVNENPKETLWISKDMDVSDDLDSGKIIEMMNQLKPNIEDDSYYEFTPGYLELYQSGFIMKSQNANGENIEVIKVVQRSILATELSVPENFIRITPAEYMHQQMMGGSSQGTDVDW
ncbi:MAG: hypothetical protein K9H16_05150 [Bacteroidales bacterium]|nr:hypothetical protein [Bacteroidales bacterium]